jgi:hypothetical protein
MFRGKIGASGKEGGCAVSEALSVLMQRDLQFCEDLPRFVGAFCGDSFSTQFSNAIIYASGAHYHQSEIQFTGGSYCF